jgi:hypothetical protein
MKNLIVLFVIFFIACQNNEPKVKENLKIENNSILADSLNNPNFTDLSNIKIPLSSGDTFDYEQKEYNLIVKKHPEFFSENVEDPDMTFNKNYDAEIFGSEVGADSYYALYSHFLMQKNGSNKFNEERKVLIKLYGLINDLYAEIQGGGSYFGHQQLRILAYAEYSIYMMPHNKSEFTKSYSINKQKDIYISMLKQLIEDEFSLKANLSQAEKKKQVQILIPKINEIGKLITSDYYLKSAIEFQANHYHYY